MILIKKRYRDKKGFSLLETLVGSAIFLLVALSAYKAFGTLMDAVTISQAKTVATAIANEKIEIIRNLPYADVGIINGIPAGKIQRTENITRDNFSFAIVTTIRNVDDPYDGIFPTDTSPADYKSVDINITCSNCKTQAPVNFTTLVAPRALETLSTNGALFIRVFNANGTAIPGAAVHIVNTQTNPVTTIDDTTDNSGWLKIVDAPPGTNAYNIRATKTGYSTDQTYPPGGAAGPNPIKPDATVVQRQATQLSFSIDLLSSISVSSVDSSCVALPSLGFSITGTKLIGTPSVLKYPTQNFTTDTTGNYTIPSIEWDTYGALLTGASYDLAGANPFPNFVVNPNENKTLKLMAVPHIDKALLVSVIDSSGVAVDGATVRLQKTGFDQTKTTNSGSCIAPGQAFWNGLGSGTYTLTVSKAGYTTYVNNSLDMAPSWQNQNITLNP